MFDLIAQAMAAWNQVGLLVGSGFLGGIGTLLLGNRIYAEPPHSPVQQQH